MSAATVTPSQSTDAQREAIAPLRPATFDVDVVLVLIVAALLATGLLMVYSTTFDWSYLEYGSPVRIFLNQLRSAVIGVAVMLLVWRMDYRILRNRGIAAAIMLVTIVALSVLLIINQNEDFGSRRALYQGSFQPGEAAKLALIIYFGAWLASRREQLHKLGYGLIPFSILVGAVGSLIVLEPDLSTAAILVLAAWTMFFLAGANIVQIGLTGVGALAVGVTLATQFNYARQRLVDHINAMQDLTQASWHVQQAIIAFTAPGKDGGSFSPNWFGIGLGQSRQKFGFLPAAHTDSIFAIIGEELGLFGCLVVIGLCTLFVWRGFKIAREAQDPFGALLAGGIASWIAYEVLLNIAVVTAVVPFTGVALPFISYGGSNLVVILTGVGLLMSISRRRPLKIERQEARADYDFGRGNRRRRVSRISRRSGPES
ncbi:MAG: cell division protein FtsW [Anaerolineae bacterium]|nr:cell division protein FtsW [Anaerolineae bacterium]